MSSGGSAAGAGGVRYRRLLLEEDLQDKQACNILVMEVRAQGPSFQQPAGGLSKQPVRGFGNRRQEVD